MITKQMNQLDNLINQEQWEIVPYEPIGQSSQSTIRFKLCNGICQPSHLAQIYCPKSIFLN
jgi:hypothetical protein